MNKRLLGSGVRLNHSAAFAQLRSMVLVKDLRAPRVCIVRFGAHRCSMRVKANRSSKNDIQYVGNRQVYDSGMMGGATAIELLV